MEKNKFLVFLTQFFFCSSRAVVPSPTWQWCLSQSIRRVSLWFRRSLHSFLLYNEGDETYNERGSNSGVHPTSGSRPSSPYPSSHWFGLRESDSMATKGDSILSHPPRGHSWGPLWCYLKGSRPLINTKTWIRGRRAADRDTAQKIHHFHRPFYLV